MPSESRNADAAGKESCREERSDDHRLHMRLRWIFVVALQKQLAV